MILTPRLILRPANIEDAPEVQAAKEAAWPELQLWMSWAYDDQKPIEAMLDFIRSITPPTLLWGFRRDNGKFAVATGLSAHEDTPDTYTTGYWCAPDQLGQGFATEATNAAIRYAFGALHAKAVTIDYLEGNEKSARIVAKLGFMPTIIRPKFHTRCSDGTLMDQHELIRTDIEGLPELDVSWPE